jgi:hypothetical protein
LDIVPNSKISPAPTSPEITLLNRQNKPSVPTNSPEIFVLVVGIFGISIPVGLVAMASVGGSVIVLVLAVLAMLVVAAATLTFVLVIADDSAEELHSHADA